MKQNQDNKTTVFDTNKAVSESRRALARELGKAPNELTMLEEEEALNRIGLCSLDFNN
jgi:hypothetical protein